MRNKKHLRTLCIAFVLCISAALVSCNSSYWCDRCCEHYDDGNRHNILYQEKVDMTLCDECYKTYVSTGELPAKD